MLCQTQFLFFDLMSVCHAATHKHFYKYPLQTLKCNENMHVLDCTYIYLGDRN